MKSGTTTLHEHLGSHPDIYMCPRKEPAYFVEEYGWSNGEQWYLGLFSDAKGQKYLGESTTDYTKMPRFNGVPGRIWRFDPNAKFIYILRDPIERTFSHYWWRVRFHGENRKMLDAIREEPYYRSVSNYAFQLKPYLEHFDREQFMIVTFERFIRNPQAVCQEVFGWLEVDKQHRIPSTDTKRRSMPEVLEQVRGKGLAHRLRYSNVWTLVGPRMPKFVRLMGRRMAIKEVVPKDVTSNDAAKWLRSIQIKEVEELSSMVGMSFSEWRALYSESIQ
jgi:hypothetical protein